MATLSDIYTYRFRIHTQGTWTLVAYRSQGVQQALSLFKHTSVGETDFEFQHRIQGQWLPDKTALDSFITAVKAYKENPPKRRNTTLTPLGKALKELILTATLLSHDESQFTQSDKRGLLETAFQEVRRNYPKQG